MGKTTCYGNDFGEQPYILSLWDLNFPNEASPYLVKPWSQLLSQMGRPGSPITTTLDKSHHGSKAKQWKDFLDRIGGGGLVTTEGRFKPTSYFPTIIGGACGR